MKMLRRTKRTFCLSICPHCISSHTSHRLLQIRRYVYRDVLRVEDGSKLMDCSLIQPVQKLCSSMKDLSLDSFRGSGNFCVTCNRCLQSPCKISDVIMRLRELSGFLRVCNFLPLIDEGTTTTPSSTLEPTGSARTSSESCGGGEYMFWCQALACTATTEIGREAACRRLAGGFFSG